MTLSSTQQQEVSMIGYEHSDCGRTAAGFPAVGWGGDCAVRALATVAYWGEHRIIQDVPGTLPDIYKHVSDAMIALMVKNGYAPTHSVDVAANELRARTGQRFPPKGQLSVRKVEEALWRQFGFTRHKGGATLTEAYEQHGDCIVTIPTHAIGIARGVAFDTLDWRLREITDEDSGMLYIERQVSGVWTWAQQPALC